MNQKNIYPHDYEAIIKAKKIIFFLHQGIDGLMEEERAFDVDNSSLLYELSKKVKSLEAIKEN